MFLQRQAGRSRAAKGAKKKGKGRKADATMLGFAAGLDYNAFERPET